MSATKPKNDYSEPMAADIEAAEECSKENSGVEVDGSTRSNYGCTVSKKGARGIEVAILTVVIACIVGLLCLPSAISIAKREKVLCIV